MNNSIQVTLSMMPVDTTVSKDANSAIGIADRIMKSMYTQQSDDLLSQLEVINKTTTDMNEFNRVVNNQENNWSSCKKIAEHLVHEAYLNLPYQDGDHTIAEANVMIPGSFSKAICESLNVSHQVNGKNYVFEQYIDDVNVDPAKKKEAIMNGLTEINEAVTNAADVVSNLSDNGVSNVLTLMDVLNQNKRDDLIATVKTLVAQQNLLMIVLRIMKNLSVAAKAVRNSRDQETAVNSRTCGQISQMVTMILVQNSNTWISKLTARDHVISILMPDELEAILSIAKLTQAQQLDRHNVVDIMKRINDKNVVRSVIVGMVKNSSYPLSTVIEVGILAGAVRRSGENINVSDNLLSEIAGSIQANNVNVAEIMKADIGKQLGILMRLLAITEHDPEAETFGVNVISQAIEYGKSWVDTLKNDNRFRNSRFDVKSTLVDKCLHNVKNTPLENSKYMDVLVDIFSKLVM